MPALTSGARTTERLAPLRSGVHKTGFSSILSDGGWAAAAQQFAEAMGFSEHPCVAVRHGDDHIHLVTTRGEVWRAGGDYRAAQRAAAELEREFGLSEAPRTRTAFRRPRRTVNATHRRGSERLGAHRESVRQGRETVARANEGMAA